MFLELKNIDIGFKTPLIQGVEISLALGEVCLLIGNNGIGKTTLIKSILKQIPLLKGEIFLNQKKIKNLTSKEIAENISVVFSKSQIPVNYTLYDLISLGKYIHYPYYFELKNIDKQEIEEIIKSLNLTEFKNFPVSKLSDGNLQKAFIGRALAQNSPMIILDEPTTHLDEDNKIMILKTLRNLAEKQNKLILFSSHDWRLAKEFSDKIGFIKNKKLQFGIAEDILISNPELSSPQIFEMHENFVAPQIFAPDFQKELLYSFLQKNFKKNLSHFKIEFHDNFWVISASNFQEKAHSFNEMMSLIQNRH